MDVTGNKIYRERTSPGANTRERKFPGHFVPLSELAGVLLAHSLLRANSLGSKKAVNLQSRHSYVCGAGGYSAEIS